MVVTLGAACTKSCLASTHPPRHALGGPAPIIRGENSYKIKADHWSALAGQTSPVSNQSVIDFPMKSVHSAAPGELDVNHLPSYLQGAQRHCVFDPLNVPPPLNFCRGLQAPGAECYRLPSSLRANIRVVTAADINCYECATWSETVEERCAWEKAFTALELNT